MNFGSTLFAGIGGLILAAVKVLENEVPASGKLKSKTTRQRY